MDRTVILTSELRKRVIVEGRRPRFCARGMEQLIISRPNIANRSKREMRERKHPLLQQQCTRTEA